MCSNLSTSQILLTASLRCCLAAMPVKGSTTSASADMSAEGSGRGGAKYLSGLTTSTCGNMLSTKWLRLGWPSGKKCSLLMCAIMSAPDLLIRPHAGQRTPVTDLAARTSPSWPCDGAEAAACNLAKAGGNNPR